MITATRSQGRHSFSAIRGTGEQGSLIVLVTGSCENEDFGKAVVVQKVLYERGTDGIE